MTRAKPAIDATRLAAANEVLTTFRGEPRQSRFEVCRSRLWYVTPWGEAAYQLRPGDRAWPTFRYGRLGMGGTEAIATAQLVRWLRGMPCRPLRCWRYWCSETVGLGTAETLRLLEAHGYGDGPETACVKCGAGDATDWFSLDGVTGPLCWMGQCRERDTNNGG